MHCSLLLAQRGAKVTLLEREAGVGGVWRYFANEHSRVQICEPGYRLIPGRLLSDFTLKNEVISALEDTAAMIESRDGKVVFGSRVEKVLNRGDYVDVSYICDGSREHTTADHVLLCVGGLQSPRRISLPCEAEFQGSIVYGISGEPDRLDVAGKHVIILGMGAFAVENARECLFNGAAHVTFLTRNRNQIIPQMLSYLGFSVEQDYMPLRQLQRQQTQQRKDGTAPFDITAIFSHAYRSCHAEEAMPQELLEMERTKDPLAMQRNRESFGTVPTASDPFFIGYALGKISTVRADVARVLAKGVETTAGQIIEADIMIKCFGFEDPDHWVSGIVEQTHMYSPMVINERVFLCKCERAKFTPELLKDVGGAKAMGDMLNIPPIAPAIAETFTDLFSYLQAKPETLRQLMRNGSLPKVKIGECNALTWSRGQWAMMKVDPALEERINQGRRAIGVNMKDRWTPMKYYKENQEWWQYCCKRISGDEHSVPYLWQPFQPIFEHLTKQAAKTKNRSGNQRGAPVLNLHSRL
eukprot:TRINITY_DN38305_c0_g1_i1.p1 TRINITY_DN38305_c0_g1~~TRINITY_DN38305_c0_g1_i1.p1  ORF type:complete len:561 (-),score=81.37 TRINITY_DN38305_c0_g1_i1:238-1815(-)